MNENTTKIITTAISATAGILTTALVGFYLTTAWSGQWWVTPKHRAKALTIVSNKTALQSDSDYINGVKSKNNSEENKDEKEGK